MDAVRVLRQATTANVKRAEGATNQPQPGTRPARGGAWRLHDPGIPPGPAGASRRPHFEPLSPSSEMTLIPSSSARGPRAALNSKESRMSTRFRATIFATLLAAAAAATPGGVARAAQTTITISMTGAPAQPRIQPVVARPRARAEAGAPSARAARPAAAAAPPRAESRRADDRARRAPRASRPAAAAAARWIAVRPADRARRCSCAWRRSRWPCAGEEATVLGGACRPPPSSDADHRAAGIAGRARGRALAAAGRVLG